MIGVFAQNGAKCSGSSSLRSSLLLTQPVLKAAGAVWRSGTGDNERGAFIWCLGWLIQLDFL